MSSVKLKHSSGNGTIINGPAANPSADITLKVPSTTGEAGQVLSVATANHSATNAELEWAAASGGGSVTNLIKNGAMKISQRGTSSTTGTYGFHVIDRYRTGWDGANEDLTIEQVAVASGTTPYTSGFRSAFKATNGNQTSGADAGDYFQIDYTVEAQDIANSGWDYTSSSSKVTISFWVKSSVAQAYIYTIKSFDGTAQVFNCKTPALTADTWTKITKTIPGNSNLTFDDNNAAGLVIMWFPYIGTTYTTSGLAEDTWSAWASTKHGVVATSTWWTTNDATFEMTGVQLETGDTANDFAHKTYADDLLDCQRYFQKADFYKYNGAPSTYDYWCDTVQLSPSMRATPTLLKTTDINVDTGTGQFKTSGGTQTTGAVIDRASSEAVVFKQKDGANWSWNTIRMHFTAEL